MKEILVAVDFSDSSINSIEHALTLAQKANSDLTLVWVKSSKASKTAVFFDSDKQIIEVKSKFEELIKKYQPLLKAGKLSYQIKEGKVYTEISMLAEELEASLIIMGAHGTSGFEQFWIGSNANRVIANAPCPVITIQEGIKIERNLERIVLPLDITMETRQKVGITTQIAHFFGAEVHILAINASGISHDKYIVEGYADMVEKHFKEFHIPYKRTYIFSDNPTKSTIEYAQQIDANLIAIMTDQVTSTKNLWLGTYAQQMVNQSPFPVLTVRAKQIYDHQAK